METKIINSGILKNYNQQIFVTADLQKSSSPIMQYASTPYSSVVLTPSTIVSTPSPQSMNSFSPIYTEESDYNLIQTNLNSPIKQEQQIQFLSGNLLPVNNQHQNQLIQLNQTNQINKISKNKRSADDNNSKVNVKRGRSRTVESNINQSINQTNIQLTINKSKEPKLNEQGQIVKPTKVRRTRAKSPTLAKKLQKVRRLKANDRERNRMHTLNKALEKLREILPVSNSLNTTSSLNDETSSNCSNKLTKIETLRFANSYIYQLKSLLEMDINQLDPNKTPESRLKEAAMAAAAATNFNTSSNQSHQLLSNSQNSYTNFSSIFQTNCAVSNGILSTTSSLSNDEDDEDLLMLMNGESLSQNEDIFDQQQQQQIYHLN